MASVGPDDQIGVDRQAALRGLCPGPGHAPALFDQCGDVGLHSELERRIALRLSGDKIQEVPLRHQGDETAMGRQMGKIGDPHKVIANLCAERAHFLVRLLEELTKEAEFVHDLERRGMNGIPAEIAQEVGVLFEDQNRDPGASEQ